MRPSVKQVFHILTKLLPVTALALLLEGCPELMGSTNPPDRTPLVATYPIAGGIDVIEAQYLLQGRYLVFTNDSNAIQQGAFDLQEGELAWQTKFFPRSRFYYLAQNDRYAYVWPLDPMPGELVVVNPGTGDTVTRLSDTRLGKGACTGYFGNITVTNDRVYALSCRSGVAVFNLDTAGLPTFVRKITIPDIESITTPTRGQLFYVMSIAMDPETKDVFVGSDSDREYGNIPDLYRIDADTGEILWKTDVEYPDNGEDAIAGRYAGHVSVVTLAGDVLIIQAGQSVQAFDPETGERYWYYELRCEGGVPGALTDSQLYVPETGRIFFGRGSQSCFYSVAASADGPDPWTLDTQDYPGHAATPQEGLPTYLDGVLYFYNGFLWAVDPYTGKPLSVSINLSGDGDVISIFNDGRYIYVPLDEGIYAFEPVRR